ncbi:MAG: hypothetical protein AB8G23_24000 [Myxococcota bacterium]
MKLRIRVEELELGESEREGIEKRIRLALGTRTVSIDSVEMALSQLSNQGRDVRCRLSLRDSRGLQTFVEEDAEDSSTAVQWVIWRMVHFLDRRALREG